MASAQKSKKKKTNDPAALAKKLSRNEKLTCGKRALGPKPQLKSEERKIVTAESINRPRQKG